MRKEGRPIIVAVGTPQAVLPRKRDGQDSQFLPVSKQPPVLEVRAPEACTAATTGQIDQAPTPPPRPPVCRAVTTLVGTDCGWLSTDDN